MREYLTYLFDTIVYAPIRDEITAGLAALPSPELVAAGRSCLSTASAMLVERAGADWWWGISSLVGVASGIAEPMSLLSGLGTDCSMVAAALTGDEQ